MTSLINKFYSIIESIQNIIRWFPIIWQDKDFDFGYVYRILYFKFKNMEEFFRSENAWSANSIKDANRIKVAKNLAKRLSESNHLENAMMFYNKKYGDKKIMTIENGWVVWTKDKKMMDAFEKCGKHSEYMEKQDKEFLFDYLKKYSDRWWD